MSIVVSEITPHEGFYCVDWDTGALWQRLFTIPTANETAVVAVQHAYGESAQTYPEVFHYNDEAAIAFAVGARYELAVQRLLQEDPDRLSDISGEAGRRLGRLLADSPMAQMIHDTVRERDLVRSVFTIPPGAPDTKYRQFAKLHGYSLEQRAGRSVWVKEY